MPNLYILAGPNGAGKTTTAMVLLPEVFNCLDFVNADSIAAGLSPLKPELSNLEAGKMMLSRIHQKIESGTTFTFETTLASKTFVDKIRKAQKLDYKVSLFFLYLSSSKIAKQRVENRVNEGGHNIQSHIIERRYKRGLENFFNLYNDLVDDWYFYDNSDIKAKLVAEKNKTYDDELWQMIRNKIA